MFYLGLLLSCPKQLTSMVLEQLTPMVIATITRRATQHNIDHHSYGTEKSISFIFNWQVRPGQLAESDSKVEDLLTMECTPVDSPSSLVSDSDGNYSDEELAPPVTKKVARSVISRYNTKHPWLISEESGKGAFCKLLW